MEEKADKLSERLLDFGVEVVKLAMKLERTMTGRVLGRQLLRSGTSAGANYEEARGAQSKEDFKYKLHIVLKEIRETLYWLKLVKKSEILKGQNLNEIINETVQLGNIIAKSIITVKEGK